MGRRYLRHNVGIQSAALAFYLLFTIFPLLIFISALLGLLQLDVAAILRTLEGLLPSEIVNFIEMYLTYVGASPSPRLLVFGLFFSIYFPMRATNALMRAVRTAYHLGPPRNSVGHVLKTLIYTVLLIVAIALTLTLMTVGERLLTFAVVNFHLPVWIAQLWARLRFPAIAVVGYFALFFLYALAQDDIQPWRNIWPGTLASLVAWMVISSLYSLYVEYVAHYSLLYGSIGTIIVLLIWLNMSSVALIMGAELNGTLIAMRREKQA
jgi:membrane protein